MDISDIKMFRRWQTIISILLFIGVFILCYNVTEFKITDIQLSFWGVDKKLSWIWNGCVAVLSISILINVILFIKQHTRLHERYTNFLKVGFILTSIFLFTTGVVDMTHRIHNVTAYLYFFAYPLIVFLFAHLNRKHLQYKEWQIHTTFAIAMVVGPLLVLKFFPGMAIPEIIHSIIVIGWNLWILTID